MIYRISNRLWLAFENDRLDILNDVEMISDNWRYDDGISPSVVHDHFNDTNIPNNENSYRKMLLQNLN